ncbi:MAG: ArsA family ATPase [Deltaproteobacteria bacterium]|nr:ArsA family ATPase [Deltaproteobacteria bacterium]
MMSPGLAEVIASKRILVSVGAGGVGKTTVSAALALAGAAVGRKSLVLTIDPARRLANALGLSEIGNEEKRIDDGVLARINVTAARGLFAMMLDAKSTFDAVVAKHAPSREVRDAILGNHLYRHVSDELSGSQSQMAMEKLLEVTRERDYDFVVLDTPPTANALDFLEMPKKMVTIMESPVLRTFLRPILSGSKTSKRLLFGSSFILSRLAKSFTGMDMLQDLAGYLVNFNAMFDGFRDRAETVYRELKGGDVAFVIVMAPRANATDEALVLYRRLASEGMPVGAIVANRVHRPVDGEIDDGAIVRALQHAGALQTISRDSITHLVKRLRDHRDDLNRLAAAERERIDDVRRAVGACPVVEVPARTEDVHDLVGLAEIRSALIDSTPARSG